MASFFQIEKLIHRPIISTPKRVRVITKNLLIQFIVFRLLGFLIILNQIFPAFSYLQFTIILKEEDMPMV